MRRLLWTLAALALGWIAWPFMRLGELCRERAARHDVPARKEDQRKRG